MFVAAGAIAAAAVIAAIYLINIPSLNKVFGKRGAATQKGGKPAEVETRGVDGSSVGGTTQGMGARSDGTGVSSQTVGCEASGYIKEDTETRTSDFGKETVGANFLTPGFDGKEAVGAYSQASGFGGTQAVGTGADFQNASAKADDEGASYSDEADANQEGARAGDEGGNSQKVAYNAEKTAESGASQTVGCEASGYIKEDTEHRTSGFDGEEAVGAMTAEGTTAGKNPEFGKDINMSQNEGFGTENSAERTSQGIGTGSAEGETRGVGGRTACAGVSSQTCAGESSQTEDSEKKGQRALAVTVKVLSALLFILFFARTLAYVSALTSVTIRVKHLGLTNPLTVAPDKVKYVLVYLTEWFSVMAVTLVTLRGFFKSATLDRLVMYAVPVYVVFAAVMYNDVSAISMQSGGMSAATVLFGLEIGLTAALSGYAWAQAIAGKFPRFDGWKSWALFFGMLVLALVPAMPVYTWQFFLGDTLKKVAENGVKGFGLNHRLLIYGGAVIPAAAYFSLRGFSKDNRRLNLLAFSLMAMAVYCGNITAVQLVKNPASWPLHLCNTAMFLVPICLVFRTNRLFYFTYFINVCGAFIAMLIPNYDVNQMMYSQNIVRFWYNHYCAFFMPVLLVALGVFDRPTIKQFKYSIIGFLMYFLLVFVMNVVLNGFGYGADYFFLYGDHVASTLGDWAKNLYDIKLPFTIAGHEFLIRPVYQSIFFVVYIGIGFAVWFVYELGFSLADAHGRLTERNRKIRVDRLALMSALDGRSIEEPMNENAGVTLQLKNFSKKYSTSKVYAVRGANLEVHGGEIFGFLGPNGAGKSTIIKSIVGIQPITEGSIEVCGYDCARQPVQAKRLIGYVPDHYALYEKLTGREYINYIADIYGISEDLRNERINKYVAMFELEGAIDNPIKTYSHGMKQKITIMAALVHDPKLWILDEPLTGLDPNSIFQVKECMKEHAARGNIVFFSSHIIDVVERICDRITIIKKGQILVTRDVADIEKEGLLEDYYLRMINGPDADKTAGHDGGTAAKSEGGENAENGDSAEKKGTYATEQDNLTGDGTDVSADGEAR